MTFGGTGGDDDQMGATPANMEIYVQLGDLDSSGESIKQPQQPHRQERQPLEEHKGEGGGGEEPPSEEAAAAAAQQGQRRRRPAGTPMPAPLKKRQGMSDLWQQQGAFRTNRKSMKDMFEEVRKGEASDAAFVTGVRSPLTRQEYIISSCILLFSPVCFSCLLILYTRDVSSTPPPSVSLAAETNGRDASHQHVSPSVKLTPPVKRTWMLSTNTRRFSEVSRARERVHLFESPRESGVLTAHAPFRNLLDLEGSLPPLTTAST